MGEGSFIGRKNVRKQHRRPPTDRRQGNATAHKTNKVWEKKRMDGRAGENGQSKIHPRRSRNGDTKSVRSPYAWQNKFVSYVPPFSDYYFACKEYGHRADECKMNAK